MTVDMDYPQKKAQTPPPARKGKETATPAFPYSNVGSKKNKGGGQKTAQKLLFKKTLGKNGVMLENC